MVFTLQSILNINEVKSRVKMKRKFAVVEQCHHQYIEQCTGVLLVAHKVAQQMPLNVAQDLFQCTNNIWRQHTHAHLDKLFESY